MNVALTVARTANSITIVKVLNLYRDYAGVIEPQTYWQFGIHVEIYLYCIRSHSVIISPLNGLTFIAAVNIEKMLRDSRNWGKNVLMNVET